MEEGTGTRPRSPARVSSWRVWLRPGGLGCTLVADSARAGWGGGSASPRRPGSVCSPDPAFYCGREPCSALPSALQGPRAPRAALAASPQPRRGSRTPHPLCCPASPPDRPPAPPGAPTPSSAAPGSPSAAASTSASSSSRPRLRGRPTPAQPLAGDRPLRSPARLAAARPHPNTPNRHVTAPARRAPRPRTLGHRDPHRISFFKIATSPTSPHPRQKPGIHTTPLLPPLAPSPATQSEEGEGEGKG